MDYTEHSSAQPASLTDTQSVNGWSSDTAQSFELSRSATPTGSLDGSSVSVGSLSWLSLLDKNPGHAISNSPKGASYDYLGCFPLGFDIHRKSFIDVARTQQRLKDMKLLDEIKPSILHEMGKFLKQFCSSSGGQDNGIASGWHAAMQELAHKLSNAGPDSVNSIRAHVGLDQGFQTQPGTQFWAVYALDEDATLDVFLSRNVQHLPGAILHTFLSSRGCPRYECFQAEFLLSKWSESLDQPSCLPPRIMQDISLLSPSELLKFLQILSLSPINGDPSLVNLIRDACEVQLLDSPDFAQLKDVSTTGYLSGRASGYDLISLRLQWYRQNGCQHPNETIALDHFLQIGATITEMLRERRITELQEVTDCLASVLQDGKIDTQVDLIAFAIFCVMRKHAFDEAYMEVTDRNTLFNDQTDQAAAFAELFATGARCEAYFDVTPSAFGKLLSDRYRAYHHQPGHEPPIWSDLKPSTESAYAAAKIDVDPSSKKSAMSAPQRFTFLSVFAIPALLDILLLTTTGRGLYLSGTMSHSEQHSATLALMISLLISGAVGTWITCGGSYYLISMAFSAMNMFVITRLVGGLAFTLAVAIIGFTAVGASNGIGGGIVFFLYLIALTSYLCLLATLANFQYPGSAFQSVRKLAHRFWEFKLTYS